jgi:TonB family protein
MYTYFRFALFLAISVTAWARQDKSAVTVDVPGQPAMAGDSTKLELVKAPTAEYPSAAFREGIQGQVWLRALISETGKVETVQVLSGDPLLLDEAVRTAKKYRFKPYIKDGKPIKLWTRIPLDFYFADKLVQLKKTALTSQEMPSSPEDAGADADAASSASSPVILSQQESENRLIHQIAPSYPHAARRNHIQGTVSFKALIGKDGRIANLTPLSGPPELIPASVGAVQQWRYQPYLQSGKPVEIETVITVNFSLSH